MLNIRLCEQRELRAIADMSKDLLEEGCCNGMTADSVEYLSKYEIWVAENRGVLIGYGYGECEISAKKTPYKSEGEKVYFIEMLYVKPEHRGCGAGAMLFDKLKARAREEGCAVIELYAVSRYYEKLLRFYVEKRGMAFWSAHLTQRL